jgi:hypothetical protein
MAELSKETRLIDEAQDHGHPTVLGDCRGHMLWHDYRHKPLSYRSCMAK